jgi:hypothetical protein
MTDLKDRVEKGLSEVRTTVLGIQIFLGFQYQALFQTGFDKLELRDKMLALAAFALLLCAAGAVIAPVSHHQIAERGQATCAQDRFNRAAMTFALAPFAVAIGLNLVVALSTSFGRTSAIALAALTTTTAIFFWFGLETIMKRPSPREPGADAPVDLKERITQMMTETRVVLPGVQALLGFQYAAYLTEPFKALSASSRIAHTAGLFLLLLSMILLMAPAPFHRLAEGGEDTQRANTVGVRLTLCGLALLGAALAADVYVALMVVSHNPRLSALLAAVVGLALLAAWFLLPFAKRTAR